MTSGRLLRLTHQLQKKGWRVIRIWEHDLLEVQKVSQRVSRELKVPNCVALNRSTSIRFTGFS